MASGGTAARIDSLGFTANSSDDSGYTINITGVSGNGTLTSKAGANVGAPFNVSSGVAAAITDSNGNKITSDSTGHFFDTLSSTVAVVTVAGTGTPASPTTFKYTAPSGATATYTMNYTAYTVQTNFGFGSDSSPIHEYGATSVNLVSSIALPDDTQQNPDRYTFTYEVTPGSCTPLANTYQANCVTGRIASVTLPTGGVITYNYSGGSHNTGIYSDGSTSTLTRFLSPSTGCASGGCWQYARSLASGTPGPGSTWTTTITDPTSQANQTVINFAEDTTTTNGTTTATYLLYETQRKVYQGSVASGTLLGTNVKCYNSNYASCATATVTSPITASTAYNVLPNGSARASAVTYNGSFTGSGLVNDEWEYEFGVTLGSAPSSTYLKSETLTTYASLGNGIINKPGVLSVHDWSTGSAVTVASSTYTYDQGTPTSTSNTPQHIAITGSRGNLTTLSTQTSSTATLTKTFTYYDTGNLNVDVNGAQTTYNYGASSCTNSFADSITEPLSLSRSFLWNCTGGVVTKVTDEMDNS